MPTATVAKRVRQRRVPSVALPPEPPKADRDTTLRSMQLTVAGRQYIIGHNIEGDPPMAATIDGAATLTVPVRDIDGDLQEALGTEAQLLETGVLATVNGIDYVLQTAAYDSGLLTLTMEDFAKERLSRFSRFMSMRRTRTATFPRFAERLVKEAAAEPLAKLDFFCPELSDRQKVPRPKERGKPGRKKGTGSSSDFAVKGRRATAAQMQVIDGLLEEAQNQGASRRVMVALIMAATQESVMGADQGSSQYAGILQQSRDWLSVAQAKNPAYAARAFLTGGIGPGRNAPGWKQVHHNLQAVPGGYQSAIEAVQHSGVSGYGQWEAEATRTVASWLGSGGDVETTETEPYEFTRGEFHGKRETSWDAIGRYAEGRNWYRWAYLNTLFLASGNELRSAAPSLELHGDEPWLLTEPAWEWNPRRSIAEIRFRVAADRWGLQIGAVVASVEEPIRGRFLVAETNGYMVNPEVEVVLRRPVAKKAEPKNETLQVAIRGATTGTTGGAGGTGSVAGSIPGSPVPGIPPHSATHPTGGLPGYPAYDYMARAGTPCVAPVSGVVTRLSGKSPSLGGPPGGPLGYSIYMTGGGKRYYLTHLDRIMVRAGQQVRQGQQMAVVANGPPSWSSPHVHMGVAG